MQQRLHRSDFMIHAMLGRHKTRGDVEPITRYAREVKPSVIITEEAGWTKKNRRKMVILQNSVIVDARKHPEGRARILDMLGEQRGPLSFPEFNKALVETIMDTPDAVKYIVEESDERNRRLVDEVVLELSLVRKRICRLLGEGRVEEAVEVYADYHHRSSEAMDRKTSIVEGFLRMEEELPTLFSKMPFLSPINMLAVYGALHINAMEELQRLGFNLTFEIDPEIERIFSYRVSRRIQMAQGQLTRNDKLILLFREVCELGVAFGALEKNEQAGEIFERIGFEEGFERVVRATEQRADAQDGVIIRRLIYQMKKAAGMD
ncbi:hypothetical protein HY988_00960 [Candidatus Micrarchaeota archaeon]|nr:hypothetical protein [Candidatus Micrarchaeota archaeon]